MTETTTQRVAARLGRAQRRASLALTGLLSATLSCARSAGTPPSPGVAPTTSSTAALAFTHVTVIDVTDGTRHPEQTVVIAGTRIHAVGPVASVQVPAGAQVVEAQGKYLIPGLWDMHVHVMGFPKVFYPLFIANGVTGIRDMGTPMPLDTVHRWQREVAQGTRVGPRQLNAGPLLDDSGPRRCYGLDHPCLFHHYSNMTPVHTPERARMLVDSLTTAGADFIKVHDLDSREEYFAVLAAARRRGIRVEGHLMPPWSSSLVEAIDSGQHTIEHGYGMGPYCTGDSATLARCTALAQRLRQHDAWLGMGPTFAFSRAVPPQEWRARLRYWPDSITRAFWLRDSAGENIVPVPAAPDTQTMAVFQRMERAGLPFLAGSDVGPGPFLLPGFLLQDGLILRVENGFTPLFALQTATLNPARYLRGTDSLGTVAAGKLADLVLLDADPLVDIRHLQQIRAVVANGRYFDRAALDALLADVAKRGAAHWGP